MKITSPMVIVDGETCHHLEAILEVGLRQYHRNGATVPESVLTFARDATAIAGHYRLTVDGPNGVSGVDGVNHRPESTPRRKMDSQEVAALAGISANGVREAVRTGRLIGKKCGRSLQFDSRDVNRWLEVSGR